jgi:predicted nucleic acid-binding protein
MSGKAFVDTNILVYAHDENDIVKHNRAVDLLDLLWDERRGVVSTQVLQEFVVNLERNVSTTLSAAEVRRRVEDFLAWEIVVNQPRAVVRALDIAERHRISFWDALIVQAAANAGCEVLYSEDFSHGQEYEGVLVVNPFQES